MLAVLAYLRNKGATPHHGLCRLSLQYEGGSKWSFGVHAGTWSMGSLRENGAEVSEEMRKRMTDVCGLHVRWRRWRGSTMFWKGCKEI